LIKNPRASESRPDAIKTFFEIKNKLYFFEKKSLQMNSKNISKHCLYMSLLLSIFMISIFINIFKDNTNNDIKKQHGRTLQ